jgi:hypothetical protein
VAFVSLGIPPGVRKPSTSTCCPTDVLAEP